MQPSDPGRPTGYDVVVVGAGSAGCALAARLSEDSKREVCLLEAGPVYASIEDYPEEIKQATSNRGAFPGHPNNWSFKGELTEFLTYSVPRGRVLGGSSAINGTYFIRGTRSDFDYWASLGNPLWAYEQVLPYFIRLENDLDYPEAEWHGDGGPVPVARDVRARSAAPVEAFFEAASWLGFKEHPDKNSDESSGVGMVPRNVADGIRVNAGISHILPAIHRRNLTVLGGQEVHRVLISHNRALGVEVWDGIRTRNVFADVVVLSAGAVKSPHILMLSGVGPGDMLYSAGIKPRLHLPGVGAAFVDHPHLNVGFRAKEGVDLSAADAVLPACLNFRSNDAQTTSDDLEIMARLAPFGAMMVGAGRASYLRGLMKILSRPRRTLGAMHGLSARRIVSDAMHQGDLSLNVALQQPESRGRLILKSPDPQRLPRVQYGYLRDDVDRRRLREGVRTAVELLASNPFQGVIARRTTPLDGDLRSDRQLDRWISRSLASAIHMSSSCPMGVDAHEGAVVDESCRVHGIDRLYTVDTSVMPYITSRGTAATAVMLGERVADLMASAPHV